MHIAARIRYSFQKVGVTWSSDEFESYWGRDSHSVIQPQTNPKVIFRQTERIFWERHIHSSWIFQFTSLLPSPQGPRNTRGKKIVFKPAIACPPAATAKQDNMRGKKEPVSATRRRENTTTRPRARREGSYVHFHKVLSPCSLVQERTRFKFLLSSITVQPDLLANKMSQPNQIIHKRSLKGK